MKVIISHGQTRREFTGPFAICASGEDLARIAKTIQDRLETNGMTYGWVDIPILAPPLPSTAPIGWDEPGPNPRRYP